MTQIITSKLVSMLAVGAALTFGGCQDNKGSNNQDNAQVEQKVLERQEERRKTFDPPYQIMNQRYGKSGLAGILAMGMAREVSSPLREIYIEQYEKMITDYNNLAEKYKSVNPNYTPKTFLSSEIVFGEVQNGY